MREELSQRVIPVIIRASYFTNMADAAHGNGAAAVHQQYTEFQAVASHGGQYIQYNIFGNLFEITNKYRPPIMPIGRGAYGIVWYVFG